VDGRKVQAHSPAKLTWLQIASAKATAEMFFPNRGESGIFAQERRQKMKADKKQITRKTKMKELKVNKSTLKDLDSQNSSQVKGAARKTGQDSCYVRTCL
jgi:hypothetical protein